jgi:hypothetical protein
LRSSSAGASIPQPEHFLRGRHLIPHTEGERGPYGHAARLTLGFVGFVPAGSAVVTPESVTSGQTDLSEACVFWGERKESSGAKRRKLRTVCAGWIGRYRGYEKGTNRIQQYITSGARMGGCKKDSFVDGLYICVVAMTGGKPLRRSGDFTQ